MQRILDNQNSELNALFSREPTAGQKAWGIMHDFYHRLLTYMDNNGISQAQLARASGKSRSAISQMLNKNPNVSIRKLVEIADIIGIDIHISSPQLNSKTLSGFSDSIELDNVVSDDSSMDDFIADNVKSIFGVTKTIEEPFSQAQGQVI